jgi:hypothetical protein
VAAPSVEELGDCGLAALLRLACDPESSVAAAAAAALKLFDLDGDFDHGGLGTT